MGLGGATASLSAMDAELQSERWVLPFTDSVRAPGHSDETVLPLRGECSGRNQ